MLIPLLFSILYQPIHSHTLLRTHTQELSTTDPATTTAQQLITGVPRHFTWNHDLSGEAWEFGLCTNSTAFGVPQFGARWPLKAGWITWYDEIPAGDGVVAYAPRQVFGVLNQKYLSSYKNENDARACNQPMEPPLPIASLTGANQGGEPVLISQQNEMDEEDKAFCIHVRSNKQDESKVTVFCMTNRVERRDWLDYLKDVIHNQQSNEKDPAASGAPVDPALFAQAPRTICSFVGTERLCLTTSPDMPNEADGADGAAASTDEAGADNVEFIKGGWLTSFPIAAIKEQEWHIEKSSGTTANDAAATTEDATKEEKVNICSSNNKCITVLNKIESTGQVPKPARKFIDCPGGNLKCFSMTHIQIGMTPTDHDTDVCENECRHEPKCQGWVYTRALATGTKYAKCCLKKRDMSLTCGTNRCCDAHMSSETKEGSFVLNGAKVPKVSNAIKMLDYAESNLYQQWVIVPEPASIENQGKSLAKLKMGSLCVAIDQTTTKTMLVMDECANGVVFNFESFESR